MKTKLTILFMLLVGMAIGQIRVDTKTSSVANIKLTNGTADTISITSKKDTLKIGTQANCTKFEADGSMSMLGNATVWDDMQFPFTTGTNAGTGYPTFNADSVYYTWVVDTTGVTKCIMYYIIQLPHSYKENSLIYPHVHYKYQTAVGVPKFKMKYKWYSTTIGAPLTSWKYVNIDQAVGTPTDNHVELVGTASGINGTHEISSILLCQLYLYNVPNNVIAYQFDIHIEKNSEGSRQITTK